MSLAKTECLSEKELLCTIPLVRVLKTLYGSLLTNNWMKIFYCYKMFNKVVVTWTKTGPYSVSVKISENSGIGGNLDEDFGSVVKWTTFMKVSWFVTLSSFILCPETQSNLRCSNRRHVRSLLTFVLYSNAQYKEYIFFYFRELGHVPLTVSVENFLSRLRLPHYIQKCL